MERRGEWTDDGRRNVERHVKRREAVRQNAGDALPVDGAAARGGNAPLRFRYLPADDPGIKEFPDWDGSKEQAWTASYDPAERVILVVIRYDSSISSYFAGTKPSPPHAYALSKAADN